VWAAESASRAEAAAAGSGGSHWGHARAEYPRLSYARELGLPPPLQLVVVGGTSWNPRPDGEGHDPDQPIPILAFSGRAGTFHAVARLHHREGGDERVDTERGPGSRGGDGGGGVGLGGGDGGVGELLYSLYQLI
jgi:hypothetical protein